MSGQVLQGNNPALGQFKNLFTFKKLSSFHLNGSNKETALLTQSYIGLKKAAEMLLSLDNTD